MRLYSQACQLINKYKLLLLFLRFDIQGIFPNSAFFLHRFELLSWEDETVHRKKTTNCCTNVGKWFILFTVSAQVTELHVLLLIFWTFFGPATVSWSILWKRECVQGYLLQGVFSLLFFFLFKCRLIYMVLLSGSLKGCYSLSSKSDSFSEPWRR